MPLWPFRRKSRRKAARASTTDLDNARVRALEHALPPRSMTAQDIIMADAPSEPGHALKKQRPETNKLQRRQRAYSFSPGRNDAITPGRRSSVRASQNTRTHVGATKEMGPGALGGEVQRVPTLHNKRDGDHLPRKKSSKKRRKDDQQREAEIKAMSNFMPLRPATEDWTNSRPLRRRSRRTTTGFGYGGFMGSSRHEWDKYNRSSDISLPESVHSTFSSDSEHISFKVSVLEKLAPRPTLHYETYSRLTAEEDSGRLARTPSRQQRKLSAPIPEATLKAHKRIHDLADELSASDLRELMERDKRRRERRRQRDQEKLEAKLARRAEKQKEAVAQAEKEGRESPPNLERGVFGREVVGLGLDSTSAVVTSSRLRQKGKEQEEEEDMEMRDDVRPDPLAEFHRTNSIPLHSPKFPEAQEEPKDAIVTPILTSPRSKNSFLRLKLPRSMSPNDSDLKTEHSEPPESSNSKGPLSWATFFRWGNKAKRSSAAPSSFSNASRDSMQTPQQPPPTAPINIPRKLSTGVPKRTRSRFREDLPELARHNSQPRDREPVPATIVESSPDPSAEQIAFAAPTHHDERNDTPTSEQRHETPSIFGHPDEPSASPEVHTLSLASIDSEASWLSGRLSKKRQPSSNLASPYGPRPRGASESDTEAVQGQATPTEAASITEDEYLARFAHSTPDRLVGNRKSTGDPRPSSDGEELGDSRGGTVRRHQPMAALVHAADEPEETHWGTVKGHQPKVVHGHAAGRVKSREGLLKSFGEEGEVDVVLSGAEGEGVQRAKSVNFGKGHARQISAGSARLLSISPRSSVDTKRLSFPAKQEKTTNQA